MFRWFDNPVLQRELLLNLRQGRSLVLLMLYILALSGLVYLAWPQDLRIEMHTAVRPEQSRRLVDLLFFGQFALSTLIAPSLSSGAIAGEKERGTYELLLTTPLRPSSILLGKLLGAVCQLALLIIASLPIVMLCLPLGGTSPLEVLAVYVAILLTTASFGLVSTAWGAYFRRSSATLVVSYLSILPVALALVWVWAMLGGGSERYRLLLVFGFLPLFCIVLWIVVFTALTRRMLHPPDLGSEGREVMDEEEEMKQAVGLVINRDQFPDRLFAPPRRNDLLPDGANPVYDKEVHSEIFSQGTLMLRLVVQISMLLALPLMGVCLFFYTQYTPEYVGYVLLFNVMVAPVFSAGSICGERERGTLELLLTTTLAPWTILWGKMISGLRISTVLTMFLVWPLALAALMNDELWPNLLALAWYVGIILCTCLTTGTIGMVSSVLFRRTSMSMLVTYLVIFVIYFGPPAANYFADTFFADTQAAQTIERIGVISPFSATSGVPLTLANKNIQPRGVDWPIAPYHIGIWLLFDAALILFVLWLFGRRWRVL